jgi:hypothetical protein
MELRRLNGPGLSLTLIWREVRDEAYGEEKREE